MTVRSIFIPFILVAVACARREGGQSTDTSPASVSPPPRADTARPPATSAPSSETWLVTPAGIGTVRVGMTADELRSAAGELPGTANTMAECTYVRPAKAPAGVLIMLARGRVARVDVDSSGVRTEGGIAVGDSAGRVTAVYGGRVTATPHKYVPGGQYLTVKPASPEDSTLRIVFETENGRVTRFRSGRVPEVAWVERCG